MKVALLCDFFSSLGGTEYYNYELAKSLHELGHEVRVYIGEKPRRNEWKAKLKQLDIDFFEPAVFHEDLNSRVIEKSFIDKHVEEIVRWKPDVIHVHPFKKMAIVWLQHSRSDKNIPIIATEWTVPGNHAAHWFEKDTKTYIHYVHTYIATCHAAAKGITDYHGFKGTIVEIPHIVRDVPKKALPISDDALFSVGCISRFSVEKGLVFLLGAWKEVSKKIPNARLHLYGHGPEEESLKTLSTCLGLSNSVYFEGTFNPGTIEEIAMKHGLFVQPSLFESIPTSIIELMLCGRPIIASATGGIPEIIQESINGYLAQPGSTNDLAAGILKLIGKKDVIEQFGLQSHALATNHYDYKKVIDSIVDVYRHAINESAKVNHVL